MRDLTKLLELLDKLNTLSQPSRKVDESLARIIGYEVSMETDPRSGSLQKIFRRSGESNAIRLPTFTESLDRAIEFADALCPGHAGAIARKGGNIVATIDDGVTAGPAPNAAIAVCMAALRQAHRKGKRDDHA
jgi:hypothetical protein